MLMVEHGPAKPPALRSIRSSLSAADIEELERRANEIAASFEDRRCAEVFPEVSPHWHVVMVLPGQERVAADKLSDRRFGVYLPESEHVEVRRGRKVEIKRLMIPGYVFVFVWDVDRQIDRIRACDGVRGMLFINGRVAIIPDAVIDDVRIAENRERPLPFVVTAGSDAAPPKKAKRYWRKTRKAEDQATNHDNDIISVHSYSPFIEDLRNAAGDPGVSAFHKALGLALNVPPESA